MGNKKNLVIIRTDGGIASQICFYSLGKYLEDKNMTVKYDTSWFDINGHDLNGHFVRNYDLEKAFPSLKISYATDKEVEDFFVKHPLTTTNIEEYKAPLYVNGYPDTIPLVLKYKQFLRDKFKPIDVDTCAELLESIKKSNSCAVHVRRGDLATYNVAYGYPVDEKYFIKAIKIILALEKDIKFFFFSEEPDWIEKNLIPKIQNINYEICRKNGSDKGYLDLYLIANSKHIIASKGSFGRFGKILSFNPDGYFITPNSGFDNITKQLPNSIIICNEKDSESKQTNKQTNTIVDIPKYKKFIQNIFSKKTIWINNKKKKLITIFGFKILINKK